MAYKLNSPMDGRISLVKPRVQTFVSELILSSEKILRKVLMPQVLLEEIEDFTERNALAVIGHSLENRKPIYKCCPNCLKAHVLKLANEMKLDNKMIKTLEKSFNRHETGHSGYYLDEGRLIKI